MCIRKHEDLLSVVGPYLHSALTLPRQIRASGRNLKISQTAAEEAIDSRTQFNVYLPSPFGMWRRENKTLRCNSFWVYMKRGYHSHLLRLARPIWISSQLRLLAVVFIMLFSNTPTKLRFSVPCLGLLYRMDWFSVTRFISKHTYNSSGIWRRCLSSTSSTYLPQRPGLTDRLPLHLSSKHCIMFIFVTTEFPGNFGTARQIGHFGDRFKSGNRMSWSQTFIVNQVRQSDFFFLMVRRCCSDST